MNMFAKPPVSTRSLLVRFTGAVMVLLTVIVLLPSTGAAQGIVTGSISGVVQDKAGAVIPSATVTATQIGTNRKFTTQSSNAGVIALPQLPVGTYSVTIEVPNFQKFEAKAVNVSVGKDTGLGAITMQVGSNTEVVTVEGAAPLVETTTNEISQTFDTKQAANLPIGNTFDSLALFVPGVATAGDASFSNANGAEFSANGQRARSNNFQLDGQNNNDSTIGGPSFFFGNQDVISEVQVITNYSAEYGRNLGSTVNYITKSGTNSFHGTAYEFNMNSGLDSLDNQEKSRITDKDGNFFFTDANGDPFCAPGQTPAVGVCGKPRPPKYVDNRFGGTFGGPIVKDRVWFFGSANFERTYSGSSAFNSSPGLTPTPNGIQQLQAAFPNSPGVAALAAFGPATVTAGNPQFGNIQTVQVSANGITVPIEFGTLSRSVPQVFKDDEATGRVDFQLTSKDRFFVRYLFQQNPTTNFSFNGPAAAAAGDFVDVPGRSQQIGLDLTHTFNPNLLNQVRFSYSRSRSFFQGGGYPNCTVQNSAGCPPQIAIDSPTDLGFGVNIVFPQGRIINNYQVQDNASWLHNKHFIKFGGEYQRQRAPNYGLFTVNGLFDYSDFNALVANTPNLTTFAVGPNVQRLKENDFALYVQDDWRVKDNLTLNLGLRWEYYGQAANLLHEQTVATQTGPNPLWDPSLPLERTTIPKFPNHYRNFGPVVGFNWTPGFGKMLFGNGATVIRGGFRIAYDFPYYNMATNVAGGAPVVLLSSFSSGTIPGLPAGTTDFSGPAIQQALLPFAPVGGDPGLASQTLLDPNFRPPYSEQWNFGIQRQIGSKAAAEVRYVGNHTLHNFQETNGNPALGPLIDAGFSDVIPAGVQPCNDPTQPGFAGGLRYADCTKTNVVEYRSTAYSIYHGLQTQFRMGNWHGLTMSAAYTFSKTIDNTSEAFSSGGYGGNALAYSQNPFDLTKAERGTSGISYPHVFGLYLQYDLPFFKGQQGFLGRALGGWEINTTYRYTSGQPYQVIQTWAPLAGFSNSLCDPANFTGGTNRDACRPILGNRAAPFDSVGFCTDPAAPDCGISDWITGNPTTMDAVHWIYNDPVAATYFGSPFLGVGRNTERGPAISTANLGVFKNLKITEKVTFQFQAQAFNVMNRQYLGPPNGRINNTVSGLFGNEHFNSNDGAAFPVNVQDGVDRRRFLFGGKIIF